MGSHVDRSNQIAIDDEGDAQVTFNHDCSDRFTHPSGKRIDFVSAKSRIERIDLKDLPLLAHQGFLARGKVVELSPEILGDFEPHTAGGGGSSPKARSISTTRPA